MKTIGIIGGFSPEATAIFYARLVAKYRMLSGGKQPHVLVWNVDVPASLEQELLVNGKQLGKFRPLLIHAAQGLAAAGAQIIVLPCNTLHVFEADLREALPIPFISIVDETVKVIRRRGTNRIGLLGSGTTAKNNLFSRKLPTVHFDTPRFGLQKRINRTLHDTVATSDTKALIGALEQTIRQFQKQNIDTVLMACTDFHQLCHPTSNMRILDTLDILVNATAHAATGMPKENML